MILAIDIGNTNFKCKAWNEAGIMFVKSFPVIEIELIVDYLRKYSPDKVVVASVGSALVENSIKRLFASVDCSFINSEASVIGVSNGYEEPDKLGVDRWLAVIEAFNESGNNACCVFDLGTALTLDVVDEKGGHRGGYIIPGLTLMRDALLKSTEKVRYESKNSTDLGYATNTADAVERGTLLVILAWMRAEIDVFKNNYPKGRVYLTGGAARQVLPFLGQNVNYREDLVLDALKRIAGN